MAAVTIASASAGTAPRNASAVSSTDAAHANGVALKASDAVSSVVVIKIDISSGLQGSLQCSVPAVLLTPWATRRIAWQVSNA